MATERYYPLCAKAKLIHKPGGQVLGVVNGSDW